MFLPDALSSSRNVNLFIRADAVRIVDVSVRSGDRDAL